MPFVYCAFTHIYEFIMGITLVNSTNYEFIMGITLVNSTNDEFRLYRSFSSLLYSSYVVPYLLSTVEL
jgi:hypothetical protein